MGRALGIQKKIDAVMRNLLPPSDKVYKRVITRTGGDELIGRPGSVTHTDTLCDPQPYYTNIVSLTRTERLHEPLVIGSSKIKAGEDLSVMFSSSAITADELGNPDLQIVLKDTAGNEEVFRIFYFTESGLESTTLIYQVIMRSISRP